MKLTIDIAQDKDVVAARQAGRIRALKLGFSLGDATLIATAISELARNIVSYTPGGTIAIADLNSKGRTGLQIVAQDRGPGIRDLELALRDGFSSSGGLGLGLPGVRRLMDDFEIESVAGQGTTIRLMKWLPTRVSGDHGT